MKDYTEIFVGIDTSKLRNAIAIAEQGRQGEIRYLGEIDNTSEATRKLVAKLAQRYQKLHFCYEAGPTGYGLHRWLTSLGQDNIVVAPSLIPKRPGDRVKTNRRDAQNLAKLLRAGDLTAVWVPDEAHEAMRDLVRARDAAVKDLRAKRQQLTSFLLRHSLSYPGKTTWTKTHARWLAGLKFEHHAHRLVLEESLSAIRDAGARIVRIEKAIAELAPEWSLAPVAQAVQALRGFDFIAAVSIVSEVGDFGRFTKPSQAMGYLGITPSEELDRRQRQAWAHHQGRQQPGAADVDRGRLGLPVSSALGGGQAGQDRRASQAGCGHRLEGANAPLRPLPGFDRKGEEAGRRRHRHRPRAGCLHLGHRA